MIQNAYIEYGAPLSKPIFSLYDNDKLFFGHTWWDVELILIVILVIHWNTEFNVEEIDYGNFR